ncbi:MAG: phosphoribosylaminoimidazolesuccinocarboxamide synthase [Methanoregulaceae archaeon]|nr:phosphoribosylaminoimidazolesuccinocarboxamide synthase [Methanoregulaceae archaeon]
MKQGDLVYSGKAKSLYRTGTEGELLVLFRDDITAFDGGKKDVLTEKGSLNARVSACLFSLLEEHRIRTHFIRSLDDSSMLVRELQMIPIEVIIRNIAAGSMVRNYPIREGTLLDPPVIVIDYKDDSRHDPMLNDDLVLALKIVSKDELLRIKDLALSVNIVLSRFFEARGIILVDFKLEFGRYNGELLVGDEISMDSMRLWDMKTKGSLDKDVYRFEKGDVLAVYRQVTEKVLKR